MKNYLNIYIKGDKYIWFVALFLAIIGLLAVYSSTGALSFKKQGGNTEYYLIKHLIFLFFSFLFMYIVHIFDYRYFSRLSQLFFWISIVLLVITLKFGNDINDAKRNLTIPVIGISFQTSDLAKLALIMYISRFLTKKQEDIKEFKNFWKILLAIVVVCGLIAPENLSTSLVLFTTCLALLFIGRVNLKYIAILIIVCVMLCLSAYKLIMNATPNSFYAVNRVLTWQARLQSFTDPDSKESFQTQQAKIAVSTGGFFGKGPGRSDQRNILPHPYSDFVFAIIIEEYGILFGAVPIIFCFLILLFRSIRIVSKSPKAYAALLAAGLGFFIVIQAFVHMGVATSLLPVTGLTLPLVSMGGTSVLFTGVAFGVLLSVSRVIEENNNNEDKTLEERIEDAYNK